MYSSWALARGNPTDERFEITEGAADKPLLLLGGGGGRLLGPFPMSISTSIKGEVTLFISLPEVCCIFFHPRLDQPQIYICANGN
jgi:hypothetical protein